MLTSSSRWCSWVAPYPDRALGTDYGWSPIAWSGRSGHHSLAYRGSGGGAFCRPSCGGPRGAAIKTSSLPQHTPTCGTTTTASGKPSTTRKDQLGGVTLAVGWVFVVAIILLGLEVGFIYADVPARVVTETAYWLGGVLVLSLLGELGFVLAQGWRRTKVLPKGREDIHRAGHSGVVVILSSYSARPRKEGHGDVVMRAWLAHADTQYIAVVGTTSCMTPAASNTAAPAPPPTPRQWRRQ